MCVDDHPLVRKGVASILANEPDIQMVAEAPNYAGVGRGAGWGRS